MKILLDPGHGGSDPGAIANGLQEKDVNLIVSNYLGELLKNAGYDVSYTRTTDVFVSLIRRSQMAAEKNANLLISLHLNAGGGHGVETYHSITDQNPTLAKTITDNIADLGFRNRGVKTRVGTNGADYYSIIRETINLSNAKPYLVEMFFIDSISDVNLYRQVGYQEMARAIYKAIIANHPISPPTNNTNYHIVQHGDTLFSIANRFNTTVPAIKSLNNLTSDNLTIGQRLLIPQSNINYFTYIVQHGDTLFSIANRFNTTVAAIKSLNNLTSDILRVSQQLSIPSNNIINSFLYTVQNGDTLFSIANRFNTTVDNIRKVNNLSSDLLRIGQQLIITTQ